MAVRYTHGHSSGILADHGRRSVTDSATFLVPHLRSDMELLDVGCGPGSITLDLSDRVARTVGIDTSRTAITAARSATGPGHAVHFVVADVHHLPFADGSFDVVFAHQVLQHLGDPVVALREAHRVLRPGGMIAVRDADYGTMVHDPHDVRLDRWLDVYHELTARNGAEADAGRRLLGWVSEAGFVEPVATTSTWTYATPESVAGWRDLWIGRLVEGRMGHDALVHGLLTEHERDDLVAAWAEWAQSPAPFFAFLHGEVVARRPA